MPGGINELIINRPLERADYRLDRKKIARKFFGLPRLK